MQPNPDIANKLKLLKRAGRKQATAEGDDKKGAPQATRLVRYAADAEFFHTPERNAFITLPADGHKETWPLRAKAVRHWLMRRFFEKEGTAPNSQAVQDALGVMEGGALFAGAQRPVFTRLAQSGGKIYLDLADDQWRIVQIDSDGWRLLSGAPVRFRRTRGMLPLPEPVTGGSVEQLRRFLNVGSETDWRLKVAWLIAAFRPTGPYPVLVEHGEQGSAKSTNARVLRSVVDPSEAALRSMSRDERDLMIAAQNSWIIALDNLSGLPVWLSDALCRLATGGGFATRELYTDDDEKIFNAQRPVIVNGIEEIATRGDLLDRAIVIELPTIPEAKRRKESDIMRELEGERPQILGALLYAVSVALRNEASVKLDRLPRMADFAVWVTAAEPGLGWPTGAFLTAYMGNRESANEMTLDASPIVPLLRRLMNGATWEGTHGELLNKLDELADEKTQRQRRWPQSPRALSNEMRRLAPNLRTAGIEIEFFREVTHARRRMVRLQNTEAVHRPNRPHEGEASGTSDGVDDVDAEIRDRSDLLPDDATVQAWQADSKAKGGEA